MKLTLLKVGRYSVFPFHCNFHHTVGLSSICDIENLRCMYVCRRQSIGNFLVVICGEKIIRLVKLKHGCSTVIHIKN